MPLDTLELWDNTFVIEYFAGINCIILPSQIQFYWSCKMDICDSKIIQFLPANLSHMPGNHSNTNLVITILIHSAKKYFENVFVMSLHCVAKDLTSSMISWHKHLDFNAVNFLHQSQ